MFSKHEILIHQKQTPPAMFLALILPHFNFSEHYFGLTVQQNENINKNSNNFYLHFQLFTINSKPFQ